MAVTGTKVIGAYLAATPPKSRETGGRKYFTQPVIDRLQEMGRTGQPSFDIASLESPIPRFGSPPYPISDMLVLGCPSAGGSFPDMTFRLGEKSYSAPVIFGEYSFGATQQEVHEAVAAVAKASNFIFGVGEGGVVPLISSNPNLMVQVATGLFGVNAQMMRDAAIVSIKMSQSAKIGMGGQLPKEKVTKTIRELRGMPEGVDILSDASRVFSIEEMRAAVDTIKAVTNGKPVFIKVGASHSLEAVAAGAARAKADGIIIDGLGGGTGAAPNVHRDHIGMPIELAVRLAHNAIGGIGMRRNFKIIAAGRVDTPDKAFKLIMLGADGVMLGTASLIALGCKVVNMCHRDCPAALTAIQKLPNGERKKALQVEWATQVLSNFYSAFTAELALMLQAYGFATPSAATGSVEGMAAVNMPPKLAAALGVGSHITGNIYPVPAGMPQDYFWNLLENLAQTGRPSVSSMGRTTDLNAPFSNLDHLTHEGRTVVGPAYDSHREVIETNVRLHGGEIIGMPLVLEGGAKHARKLAREMNTLVIGHEGMEDSRHALIPIKPDGMERSRNRIMDSSGVILPSGEVTEEDIGWLKLHCPNVAAYCVVKSDENVREEAIRLAKLGVQGIIIEGSLWMKEAVPIDVAVSQAHDALMSDTHPANGNMLRDEVKIFARTKIRSSRDIYALNCLGADAIICDPSGLIGNPTYERQLNLLRGLMAEDRQLMGASGLSMMSSIVGNRGILRAGIYMPEETAKLLGVEFIGT